jgi:hypothetical protein
VRPEVDGVRVEGIADPFGQLGAALMLRIGDRVQELACANAWGRAYGVVVLRTNGGARGEFGPIQRHQAELRPECDDMLRSVQEFVQQHPDICSSM